MPEINELLPRESLEAMSLRERKKQETRWRIFEAAFELFGQHGYDPVKIEEICKAAEVSNAAFFHHFSNKAALIHTYLDRLKSEVSSKLRDSQDMSCAEKLRLVSREVKKYAESSASFAPQMFSAISATDRPLNFERVDSGVTGALAQIIHEGQSRGEFNKHWHAELLAVNLVATWLLLPMAARYPDFPEEPYDEALELVLSGLTS